MRLKILGSGSAGNCYILENDSTALVLECGVNIKEIKQGLDFNLSKVAGALVSHEHKDHSIAGEDIMAAGIKVYCSAGTAEAMGWKSHRLNLMKKMVKYHIGQFQVMPFDVKHDCKEPFGFVIYHPQCGNVLFITDSFYVPHTFKNLNNILVEANYCPEIVKERMAVQSMHPSVRARVIESHMSINTCKDLLKANDLTGVNNIVLIHLSDGNSNAAGFKKQVEDLTGKTVHIASKNMEINLSKTPF
jgi:phosphoribosyl 1,2-cyclic phosphodiesterase